MQEAKVMDQTRGILTYVEQNCPGRFHSNIEYVTVAGKYIQGAGLRDKGATIPQKIVGAGYQQVSRSHRGSFCCSCVSVVSLVTSSCMVTVNVFCMVRVSVSCMVRADYWLHHHPLAVGLFASQLMVEAAL